MIVTINLEVNDVNKLISIIGEAPFNQVSDLVYKIRSQVVQQTNAVLQASIEKSEMEDKINASNQI